MRAFTVDYVGLSPQLRTTVYVTSCEKTVEAAALWDTGATGTCISERVVSELGLIPTGMELISTPSGGLEANTYLVDIHLPNKVTVRNVKVMDSKIGDQGVDVLVGMDIITRGDFAVSCFGGNTCFSFRIPSIEKTDYVKSLRIEKAIGQRHGGGKKNTKKKKRK